VYKRQVCGWSASLAAKKYIEKHKIRVESISWNKTGIHEVQAYLSMVGASWNDFDGYILNVADTPILADSKFRIALANPENTAQAVKKRWNKFPQLSKELEVLGFDVVLLGSGNELEGCVGENFVGKLSIQQSAKVLQQCDLLIGASTALTLIADAVKTPVMLLEGPMITSRAHPVQSQYTIVRKYISCAPCFQTPVWNMCQQAHCMDLIEASDVLKALFEFIPKLKRKNYVWNVENPHFEVSTVELPKVDKKIAYMVSAFNRFHTFSTFLQSFRESDPLPGTIFFWNDGSYDPRIIKLIRSFKMLGMKIRYSNSDPMFEKSNECRIPSTRVGNLLRDKIISADADENFDYVAYLDADVVFKPKWLQKSILMFEEAKKHHNIYAFSMLNSRSKGMQDLNKKDDRIFVTEFGKYRLRNGVYIQYIVPMDFFKTTFGAYNTNATSSDLSKTAELKEQGYECAVGIPAMTQHIGALESTFRHRTGVVAEDF